MKKTNRINVPQLINELSAENAEAAAALVLSLVAGLVRKHPEVAKPMLTQLIGQLTMLQHSPEKTDLGAKYD